MTITTHPPRTLPSTAPYSPWIARVTALALAGALAIGGAVFIGGSQPAPAAQTELRDGWHVTIPTNTSGAISSNDCAFWC